MSQHDQEPEDHYLAVLEAKKWFDTNRRYNTLTQKDLRINFHPDFIKKHHLQYNFHKYDLAVFHYPKYDLRLPEALLAIIEIRQDFEDKIALPTGKSLKLTLSKHTKKKQTMNDNISRSYIEEYYPNTAYFDIQKTECFNPHALDVFFGGLQ